MTLAIKSLDLFELICDYPYIKLLPLQGALLIGIIPRALPWAKSFWAFSPYLNHLRNLNL